jgi:hypothetical protein
MRQLTGFPIVACSNSKAWASPTPEGRQRGLSTAFGSDQPVRPLFAASELNRGDILATYPDGTAAVAWHKDSDGPRIFVGPPGLTSELLRAAAREAGVHLFTETDCIVYARDSFVVIHASQDGSITLKLPAPPASAGRAASWIVTDVNTGQTVGRGGSVRLVLKRGDTKVLHYE